MLKDYILAELRAAWLRTKTAAADLEAIGLALSQDLVSPQEAADAARNVNALRLGAPAPFIDGGAWRIDLSGAAE